MQSRYLSQRSGHKKESSAVWNRKHKNQSLVASHEKNYFGEYQEKRARTKQGKRTDEQPVTQFDDHFKTVHIRTSSDERDYKDILDLDISGNDHIHVIHERHTSVDNNDMSPHINGPPAMLPHFGSQPNIHANRAMSSRPFINSIADVKSPVSPPMQQKNFSNLLQYKSHENLQDALHNPQTIKGIVDGPINMFRSALHLQPY